MVRAVVVVLLVIFPFTAAAQAPAPPAIAVSVDAMNRKGFADFAASDERAAEMFVSPLLTWYVRRVLSVRAAEPEAQQLVAFLKQSGVSFESTIHAAYGRSGYDGAIAARERDDLLTSTIWDQPQNIGRFAWSLDVTIRSDDVLETKSFAAAGGSFVRAPFSAQEGLRAVRLDALHSSRSLYLFFGPAPLLDGMRRKMSATVWQSVASRFSDSELEISNLDLHRRGGDRFTSDSSEGFGSFSWPMRPRTGGIDFEFDASLSAVRTALHATIQGYPVVKDPNAPRSFDMPPSIDYIVIPPEHQFSVVVPMLYVLQDRRSRIIFLMGEHD